MVVAIFLTFVFPERPNGSSAYVLPVLNLDQIRFAVALVILFQTLLCFGLLMSFAFIADILGEIREDTGQILDLRKEEQTKRT